jgi:hypothetical protein
MVSWPGFKSFFKKYVKISLSKAKIRSFDFFSGAAQKNEREKSVRKRTNGPETGHFWADTGAKTGLTKHLSVF